MDTSFRRKIILPVGLLLSLMAGLTAPVWARGGLSLTPGYVRVDIPSGQDIQFASVAVGNSTGAAVRLTATVVDVDTDSSTLAPLGTSVSIATKSVTLVNPSLSVAPDKSVNLIARVDGSRLAAGGQYTSIVIKQVVDTPNKNVPITQAVSIGVFIVKEAGADRNLSLQTHLPSGLLTSPPASLMLQFHASGNVAVVPRAALSIKEGDEVLAKATINDKSKDILPGNSRSFSVGLQYQKTLSPGKHKVVVAYRYDGQTDPVIKESTFWYIPVWYLLLTLLGLVLIIGFAWHYLRPHKSSPHLDNEATIRAPEVVKTAAMLLKEEALPRSGVMAIEPSTAKQPAKKSPKTKKEPSKKSTSKRTKSLKQEQSKTKPKKQVKKSK